ncbi:immunoglobulin superfamily member 1-like [Notamacropus eugenii]|uniref:immunoglobulin superfamily member 1-like n=1 Tax=Notamacropus eugenii TaxID=9315 RepID=UPI003B672B27
MGLTIAFLMFTGKLPRPILWPQPELLVAPGDNVTLWCSRPKLSSHEEVTFILGKVGTQKPLQKQISAHLWTSFSLSSVKPEHHGSYNCTYREQKEPARESEPSEALQLVVPGSLSKPSLSVLPGPVVEPGMLVTLQCQQPPHTSLWRATFTLLRMGTSQPLKSQSPSGTLAVFPLISLSAQDAGNYSCFYQDRTVPYKISQPSEVLEIWVIDVPPRPSLSAWPGPKVASGSDVTFFCWGPSRGTRFVLYKEEDEKNLLSMDIVQHGALYFLNHVTPKYSGNYSCTYQLSINEHLWKQHSDSLQLIVTSSEFSNTLIIILSCVSFLLLLLCLLLLAVLCQGSIPVDTGMATERPRELSVPLAEDPQRVTYTELNARNLNKRKANPKESPREPTLYATLSLK